MTDTNHVRERFEDGGTVVGARLRTFDPAMIEVYGELGFDFVWLDFEHAGPSPDNSRRIEAFARAADAAGIGIVARLPSPEQHLVGKVLDAGVETVLIPRIDGPGEIREAVAASRFVYDGGPGARGADVGRATRYGAAMDGYPGRADATTLVGAMVETAAAVENLEEILSVPDLGFLFVGPSDLSTSMGHPLETDHPEVQETIAGIRERCLAAGVPVGYPVDTTEDALGAAEEGYRMLRVGDEISAVRQTLGPRLDAVRDPG